MLSLDTNAVNLPFLILDNKINFLKQNYDKIFRLQIYFLLYLNFPQSYNLQQN